VQLFTDGGNGTGTPIVGAVGPLQFDVLKHRMASEYKVDLRLTPMPHRVARWPRGTFDPEMVRHSQLVKLVHDREGRPVLLSESASYLERMTERHPGLELADTAV
jgi:peptide chain release factor 3